MLYTIYILQEGAFLSWCLALELVVVVSLSYWGLFGLVPQVHPAFFLVWTWTEHGTLVEAPPRSPSTTYLLDTTRQTRLAAACAVVEAAAAVAHRRHTVGRKAENGPVIYFLSSYNGNANFYIQVPSGAKADKIGESGIKQFNNSITIYQPICHSQVGVEILVKHQIGFTTDTSLGFQIQGVGLIVVDCLFLLCYLL